MYICTLGPCYIKDPLQSCITIWVFIGEHLTNEIDFFTHSTLSLATATHNFKCLNISHMHNLNSNTPGKFNVPFPFKLFYLKDTLNGDQIFFSI